MKARFTPIVLCLSLLGFLAGPVFAATPSNSSTPPKKIVVAKNNKKTSKPVADSVNTDPLKVPNVNSSSIANDGSNAAGNSQIEGPTDLPSRGPLYLPVDLDVPGQSFVSSGPYIGVPLEFAGGYLIVNSPSVNEDVILLNIDKSIDQRLKALGRPTGKALGSHILLSGLVEAQALGRNGPGMRGSSDIDLTSVNLDAYIMGPSPWTSAFFEFAYDNNIGTDTGAFSSNNRVLNSRVFVTKGFIILGDFTQSPFYASFGQMYVPFGVYSTTMVSAPLTRILARTLARPLVVGYKSQSENSLLATAYIFSGPSHVNGSNNINNGGINVSYSFKQEKYTAVIGGGVISNIADSLGMQFTGNNNANPPLFGGFGGPIETYTVGGATNIPSSDIRQIATGNEDLVHRVPAYDLNLKFSLGDNWQMIAEYIFASTNFNNQDLQFDDKGAKPQAANIEVVYNIPWITFPTSISGGYQLSEDALAIGLPAKRYSITANTSFWRNTLQSLELRRDINYGKTDTSTGSGVTGPSGNGNSANVITLQFQYYF